MTVYETYPFGEPFVKNVFCWPDWEANTVYRELPTFPTATSATTTGRTASAGSTLQATASSTSTGTAESESEPASASSDQPSNKGWIAGAVVGPVCGVALGLFGVWVGYRKVRKARAMQAEAALAPHIAQSQYMRGGYPPQEVYGQGVYAQQHVELDSSSLHQKP